MCCTSSDNPFLANLLTLQTPCNGLRSGCTVHNNQNMEALQWQTSNSKNYFAREKASCMIQEKYAKQHTPTISLSLLFDPYTIH